jgi:hypothetical protein
MALHEPRSQTPEHPQPLTGIYEVIKRFNRNTTWVATGLLGCVVFAALMVAIKERHEKADDLTGEAGQAIVDPLVNANPAAISDIVGPKEKSTAAIASGQVTSVDRGLISEIKDPDTQENATSWSPAHWQDHAQSIGLKITRARSSGPIRPKFIDVKARLIALWHQSLAQSEKSRNWTAFSNSNKGARKKVAYTAETRH